MEQLNSYLTHKNGKPKIGPSMLLYQVGDKMTSGESGDPDDKKRRTPFDDIFERINKMMEDLSRNLPFFLGETLPKSPSNRPKPFVWGIKMNLDANGRPEFEQFGNMSENDQGFDRVTDERSPLVDVIEEVDIIRIIAELPGVSKEDIDLSAAENSVTIEARSSNRRYRKEIELPGIVNPETAKARLKNGLLEIILDRIA
ncbi:MAG: archaeal heat shock protein Hsp20 [Candidatus Thorarchaeota archaeon]